MLTVTIDRALLELPPLVLTGSRETTTSGLWIAAGGYQKPTFEPRRTYAPDSAWVPGKALLAVMLDQGVLPLVIRAQGADDDDLDARKQLLEQALGQFVFTVTVDLDGVVDAWAGDYSVPSWSLPTAADRVDHRARATVSIPVNP